MPALAIDDPDALPPEEPPRADLEALMQEAAPLPATPPAAPAPPPMPLPATPAAAAPPAMTEPAPVSVPPVPPAPALPPPGTPTALPPHTAVLQERVPTEREKAIQGALDKNEQEQEHLVLKAAEQEHAKAQAATMAADARAALKAKQAEELKKELAAHDAAVQHRIDLAAAEDAKYRQQLADFNNERNGFWATRTTPQKVAANIALILGIFGGAKDGSNVGADRIKQAIDEDTAERRKRLEAQLGILERSRADVTATKQDLRRRIEALDLRSAAALEAAAAQAEARGKRIGIPDADIAANQAILKLRNDALVLRQRWEQGVSPTVRDEMALNRFKQRPAGGGGGGGGKLADAAAILTEMIEGGKDGAPYPTAELQRKAAALGFPLTGKSGTLSLDSLLKSTTFRQRAMDSHEGAGNRRERLDEVKFKNFSQQHGLPKLEYSTRKLEEVASKLKSGNPVSAMSSLMEFDAAAKGGNATEASMHAIQQRLGGTWDRLRGYVERNDTGGFGPKEMQNLREAVDDALRANRESAGKVQEAFGAQFDMNDPAVAKRAAGTFGPFGLHAGGGEPKIPPGARLGRQKSTGKRGYLLNGKFTALE
jgi:hypothetical protein